MGVHFCVGSPWPKNRPRLNAGVSGHVNYHAEFTALLRLFFDLVQCQSGRSISAGEAWLNDAQTLSLKLFRHLVAMQALAKESIIALNERQSFSYVDHGSVKVLARAALETYLVFYYIFGSSDQSLCKFRYLTWKLGGLVDRQRFHVSTAENKKVLARERDRIMELRQEIASASQLHAFTPNQQKQILGGKWKVGHGWADLGDQAGFHKEYFHTIYSYLCSYSHSSYISALQVGEAQNVEDQRILAEAMMGIGLVLMAHFAFSYSSLFPSATKVLDSNASAKLIAERWRFGKDEMAEIYVR